MKCAALFGVLALSAAGTAAAAPRHNHDTAPALRTEAQDTIARRVGFQAHSYNDLREWPQLLRKGAQLLKIDPNYKSASFCKSQTRVDTSDPRGCFVLNHDTPSVLSSRDDYNSTDDVLALLQDPSEEFQAWFTRPERTYIALCFKSQPVNICGNSTATTNWLSLVDDLVESYSAAIEANALNVEFVLDSNVPADCWIQRWRPWVSTGGPDEAFWSDNATLGYDRWQVMNPKVGSTFEQYASDDWGKFVNSSYAFQVWEPEDQEEILDTIELYVDVGVDHALGLHFAINQDPAVFDVYAAPLTGNGWHQSVASDATAPLVTVAAVGGDSNLLVTAFTDPEGAVQVTTEPFAAARQVWNSHRARGGRGPQSALLQGVDESVSTAGGRLSSAASLVLFSPAGANSTLYSASDASGELQLVGSLPVMNAALVDTDTVASVRVDGGGLVLDLFGLTGLEVTPLASVVVDAAAEAGAGGASVAFADLDADGTREGLVVYADGQGAVFGAMVTLSPSSPPSATVEFAGTQLDVGSAPAVAALGSALMEVHADGFCQNNEAQNKQPNPGVCDHSRSSTAGVLQYNYGSISAWRGELERGTLLNACSDLVFHGTYDLGHAPAVALYASSSGEVAVAAVHEAYATSDKDAGKCGPPLPADGDAMLDAWALPPLP